MIALENVSKAFAAKAVLAPTSLAPSQGRTTVLLGPSGCGKSTLLRLMVGLIAPDSGRALFDGTEISPANVDTVRHRIGYVIQEGGLFPHLDGIGNVTLLAGYLGRDQGWIEGRVSALCALVRIPRELLQRYPHELSGGERQRVALMRALMLEPEVLLMDEPLAALDAITRRELQGELKELFAALAKTVVLVTHDLHEAAWFGDEIVLMRAGRIVQRGSLEDLLQRPAEPFVTQFVRAQRADPRLVAK
ncbi:MAG TPA: ATP-binding cassette domain-containing protein [Burkholderiales bacterium]|nr:ATP-binding cassette domain-containing protein [Burkholderiales bacterium]